MNNTQHYNSGTEHLPGIDMSLPLLNGEVIISKKPCKHNEYKNKPKNVCLAYIDISKFSEKKEE